MPQELGSPATAAESKGLKCFMDTQWWNKQFASLGCAEFVLSGILIGRKMKNFYFLPHQENTKMFIFFFFTWRRNIEFPVVTLQDGFLHTAALGTALPQSIS